MTDTERKCWNSQVFDSSAVEAMTKVSEVGSRQQVNNVTETDAHLLICLAAQLALEVHKP